ncbi:expressed unknown protein [Seminavis robusta]|uniref:Uncharacterized protein n=1 Tax=Seminavis robusta TaxID=568900 RepID=A0A9N8I1L0_9STRA|nr:expressed unknown protein [Seminavis robusta]|eukprot:Sro3831_g351310.1 n/a (391) ;mRNA; r:2270-3442
MKLVLSICLCTLVSGLTNHMQASTNLPPYRQSPVLFASRIDVTNNVFDTFEHDPGLFEPIIDVAKPGVDKDLHHDSNTPLMPHSSAALSDFTEHGDGINVLQPQHSTPEKAVKNISHKRVKQLGRAGTASIQQGLHSAFGLGSVLFGSQHFMHLLTNGFEAPISQEKILALGAMHVLVAFAGLPRLDWKNEKEAARNAMIWPVPVQNLWLVLASVTEFTQGQDALVSIGSTPFMAFSALNIVIAAWQSSQSFVSGGASEAEKQKSGIWYENPLKNAAAAVLSYTLPIMVFGFELMHLGGNVGQEQIIQFASSHPDHSNLAVNVFLNTCFVNNIAIFGATLVKYKVVPTGKMAIFYEVFASAVIFGAFFVFAVGGDGGMMMQDLVDLLSQA